MHAAEVEYLKHARDRLVALFEGERLPELIPAVSDRRVQWRR